MSLEPLQHPPSLDPAAHSVDSRQWSGEVYHLVRSGEEYLAWVAWPDHEACVYPVPGQDAGRRFLDSEQARSLLTWGRGEEIVRISVVDPDGFRLVASATVRVDTDQDPDAVAFAAFDGTQQSSYTLRRYAEIPEAVEAFAAWADEMAARIEGDRPLQFSDYGDIVAAHLRYRGALARADAARSRLGDRIRLQEAAIRDRRAIRPVAHSLDVSREFFYRVLAGEEWVLPKRQAPGRNKRGHS